MKQNLKYPKVTIITTVFNDKIKIEDTIQSVIEQNYPNLEYIIIDAASTDGTLGVINKYTEKLTKVISESDKNVYDGMNKGINHATGEWINFMNCGDSFHDKDVISRIFSKEQLDKIDVIYGDCVANYGSAGSRRINVNNKLPFWQRYICHQSVFARTSFLKEKPFNIRLGPSADYEFLVRLYYNNNNFKYINFPVSIRSGYGYSDINRHLAAKMNLSIIKNYIPSFKAYLFYFKQVLLILVKQFGKSILPYKFQSRIRRTLSK